jgi:hypothetical protein
MNQEAPIKLHYQYNGTVMYHVSNINVVLQEIAQALDTFSPSSLENDQKLLADIAHKLKGIQDSSKSDFLLFEGHSNQKQKDYESGLQQLKKSEDLYLTKYLDIGLVWGARRRVWELLGYTGQVNTCAESAQTQSAETQSAETNYFRIPRLLIDPPSFFPSVEEGISHFKEQGFRIFVPKPWEAYLVEEKIDESHGSFQKIRKDKEGFLKSLVTAIGTYSVKLQMLDEIYSIFKSSHCGGEIASTNQLSRFFSYVQKRINLLVSKIQLIQDEAKIINSFDHDIIRHEFKQIRASIEGLIDVIKLKMQEQNARM